MPDYRLKILGQYTNGRPWSTRFHVTGSATEPALSAAFSSALTAMWNGGTPAFSSYFSPEVKIIGTLTSTMSPTMKQTTGTPTEVFLPGTGTVGSMAYQTSPLISLRTPQMTRSGRGRSYLPPMDVAQIIDDTMVEATQTAVAAGVETFIGAVKATGVQFFLYNEYTLKDGTPPFTKTIVNYAEVSSKFATQRRRTRKIIPSYVGAPV
jgi:hypothetical protein